MIIANRSTLLLSAAALGLTFTMSTGASAQVMTENCAMLNAMLEDANNGIVDGDLLSVQQIAEDNDDARCAAYLAEIQAEGGVEEALQDDSNDDSDDNTGPDMDEDDDAEDSSDDS